MELIKQNSQTKLIKSLIVIFLGSLILAISATLDGQTTAHYLSKLLNKNGNKITRLAYGVPIGGELDYLDDGTITQALKGRTLFE